MITIPTPGLRTIADLAEHMGIPAHEQVKTPFLQRRWQAGGCGGARR